MLVVPTPTTTDAPIEVFGCHINELEDLALRWSEPKYRGRQIFHALYRSRATNKDEALTCLPKLLRQRFNDPEHITWVRPFDSVVQSDDGTRKFRFVTDNQEGYEAVYLPEVARDRRTNTLCISSQTGCAVGCKFCFTASIKRLRNLSVAEIIGQVIAVRQAVAPLGDEARITNIVFMGMGEPMLNYDNVIKAIQILTSPEGLDFSTRRITVSTAGIVPRIADLGRDVATQLAVSLNATTNEVRDHIMPINKKWPLETLVAAMRAYPLAPRRRITVEYVLLKDINDSIQDAKRLPMLLQGIPVKINLLPLNPHDRTTFETPSEQVTNAFQDHLRRAGLNAIVRRPRGRDVAGACGQLGDASLTPHAKN